MGIFPSDKLEALRLVLAQAIYDANQAGDYAFSVEVGKLSKVVSTKLRGE